MNIDRYVLLYIEWLIIYNFQCCTSTNARSNGNSPSQPIVSLRLAPRVSSRSRKAARARSRSATRPLPCSSRALCRACAMSASTAASVSAVSPSRSQRRPTVARTTALRTPRLAKPSPAPYSARARRRTVASSREGTASPACAGAKRPAGDCGGLRAVRCASRFRAAAVKALAVLGGQLVRVVRTIARRLGREKTRLVTFCDCGAARRGSGAYSSSSAFARKLSTIKFLTSVRRVSCNVITWEEECTYTWAKEALDS